MATANTPSERLTQLRMERATSLLAETNMPVTEIALEIGYQTPSAFSAVFRRLVGVTPTEFLSVPAWRRAWTEVIPFYAFSQ